MIAKLPSKCKNGATMNSCLTNTYDFKILIQRQETILKFLIQKIIISNLPSVRVVNLIMFIALFSLGK